MHIFKMLLPVTRCILTINVFFAAIDIVFGLECFECTLSDPECAKPTQSNTPTVDCRYSLFTLIPDNIQARMRGTEGDDDFRCLTTVERNSTCSLYTRRCALMSEKILCELKSRENFGLEFEKCNICNEDYCNSSISHESNLMCIYLLVVMFVLKINYL